MLRWRVTVHFSNPDGTLEVYLEAPNEDEACDKAHKIADKVDIFYTEAVTV